MYYNVNVNYLWNNSNQSDTLYSSHKDVLNNKVLLVIPSEDGFISNENINNFGIVLWKTLIN